MAEVRLGFYEAMFEQDLIMSGTRYDLRGVIGATISAALLSITSSGAFAQDYETPGAEQRTVTAEDYRRYEAERLRQERQRLERERRVQERLRLENERLRQDNELREQERLRLENERLRREIELIRQEQLRLEVEAQERQRAEAADESIDPEAYEQLQKIGHLYDQGILTDEEFQRLKNRILD